MKKRRMLYGVLASLCSASVLPSVLPLPTASAATPVQGLLTGEVQRLSVDNPADIWSGGKIVVAGQNIILPRNLLADLPANRLTVQQLFAQAPPACLAVHESGLARADTCTALKHGAIVTIAANKTPDGALIAGDVFYQKGIEVINGLITYLNTTDGYFRLNGRVNDPTTGVMVRLNDPAGRQSVQQGAGCAAGSQNCSPDPRFTEDPDNYTQAFSTGYPLCIPSTVARTFTDTLGVAGPAGATATAQAAPDGTGDVLCPSANRPAAIPGSVVTAADSRRFAPLQVGDHVAVSGNFETIDGVDFLSAWHTINGTVLLTTSTAPDQPDYMIIDQAFVDLPAFFLNRARSSVIGHTTLADAKDDAMVWTTHHDPTTNAVHEFPMSSVAGCNVATGGCSEIIGPQSFRVLTRDDGFLGAGRGARKDDACAQLRADPRFTPAPCPLGGTPEEELGVVSPITHELQARTGRKFADLARPGGPVLLSVDVNGQDAKNGQYLFPMGMGLGGLESQVPLVEGNVGALFTPFTFDGIPWNLDRRLSPGGCLNGCESTPQPLSPFPFSGLDPRTQARSIPNGIYRDPAYTASPLSRASNRILSFVSAARNNFDGDATVLTYPPVDPGTLPITVTTPLTTPGSTPPAITSFSPSSGPAGASISILGASFTGTTSVTVNGSPALFRSVSDTAITAVVPAGATSGPITVTNAAGSATSAGTFTVVVPSLASFSPTSGPAGTPVTITGTGLTGANAVAFNGTSAMFATVSDSTVKTAVPAGATTGRITVSLPGGAAVTSTANFTVIASAISGFTPPSASVGTPVTINGTGLTGATSVSFNGVAALFSGSSDSAIATVVPPGATTGPVSVALAGATVTSPAAFTVTTPAAPSITNFTPVSGTVGTPVTISGAGFAGTRAVTFNGTAALFSVANDTTINTVVPSGATRGVIVVATPSATVTSSPVSFTVTPGVPTGVSASAISTSQIQVSWTPSTAPVTAYRVFRDGGSVPVGSVATPTATFTDSGLATGSTHSYAVAGFDGATGTQSSQSAAAAATTQFPGITVSPASLSFPQGQPAPRQQTLTVNSAGTANLVIGSVIKGGSNKADFTITTNGCSGAGATLTPGQSCAITVTFAPALLPLGGRSATLTIGSNAATSPTVVQMVGSP